MKKIITVLSFATFFSVTSFLVCLRYDSISDGVECFIVSLRNIISDAEYKLKDFKLSFEDIKEYKDENEKLRLEIERLKTEDMSSSEYKSKYEELYSLLDLKNEMDNLYKTTAAKVISHSADNWYDTIVINKGKYSGICIGDSVISNIGVVGKVKKVCKGYSIVSTILNPDVSFSVRSARSGELFQVEGDIGLSKKKMCKINCTQNSNNLMLGDVLETTGFGIMFPEGVKVGNVVEMKSDENNSYAIIDVSADLSEIREVLVVSVKD